MATATEHQNKWQHNRQFLASIPANCPDWMMTAAYQAAVHAAECLLKKDSTGHSVGGANLHQTLKTNPRYRSIWKCLRPLFEASQVARHHCDVSQWMSAEEVKSKLIGEKLGSLEQLVTRLMSLDRNAFKPIQTSNEVLKPIAVAPAPAPTAAPKPAPIPAPAAAPVQVAPPTPAPISAPEPKPVEIDPLALPHQLAAKVETPAPAPAPAPEAAPAANRASLFAPSTTQMLDNAA